MRAQWIPTNSKQDFKRISFAEMRDQTILRFLFDLLKTGYCVNERADYHVPVIHTDSVEAFVIDVNVMGDRIIGLSVQW
jgi:hypothetical protein